MYSLPGGFRLDMDILKANKMKYQPYAKKRNASAAAEVQSESESEIESEDEEEAGKQCATREPFPDADVLPPSLEVLPFPNDLFENTDAIAELKNKVQEQTECMTEMNRRMEELSSAVSAARQGLLALRNIAASRPFLPGDEGWYGALVFQTM